MAGPARHVSCNSIAVPLVMMRPLILREPALHMLRSHVDLRRYAREALIVSQPQPLEYSIWRGDEY
jgi:hypothetical protein